MIELVAGDEAPGKNAITDARREQNRRAQRAFRKRRHAIKERPPRTTRRQLALRPPEVGVDFTHFETDILHQTQNVLSEGAFTRSNPGRFMTRLEGQEDTNCVSANETTFTFASPQILFPGQKSLVPKRCNSYSELLEIIRGRPAPTLWPHGVPATLAACLFNASALGIDIERIMDQGYMSPFCRASSAFSFSESSPVRAQFNLISQPHLLASSSLRPCLAQISFPHHACIDLLPLPRLREVAVILSVRAPCPEASLSAGGDEVQELKRDVYVRQGIRFRGTHQLEGEEYVMDDEGGLHCGQPWEIRSWAVAPWFAQKWEFAMAT